MREYSTKDIVRFFFEDNDYPVSKLEFTSNKIGSGDRVVEVFNSLKHDGCLRDGYRFEHESAQRISLGITPYDPCGTLVSTGYESYRLVDSQLWVWVPLIKIDKLFMDALVVDE